jgi:hypothetical protein
MELSDIEEEESDPSSITETVMWALENGDARVEVYVEEV